MLSVKVHSTFRFLNFPFSRPAFLSSSSASRSNAANFAFAFRLDAHILADNHAPVVIATAADPAKSAVTVPATVLKV